MKVIYLFSLLLLHTLPQVLGQALCVEAVIYSHSTQKGLPYASIGVKHSSKGTVSDAMGHFQLVVGQTDTLVFSAVGYQTIQLPAQAVTPSLYLTEQAHSLPEITVRNGSTKPIKVGNLKARTYVSMGGANQYAVLLQPPAGSTPLLEEVAFELQPDIRGKSNGSTALRLRVYANDRGKPGRDLLADNQLFQVTRKAKKLLVNVSAYTIPVPPSGIFIGLDFIGHYNAQGTLVPFDRTTRPLHLRLPFTAEGPAIPTYSRFFGTGWQDVRHRRSDGTPVQVSAKFSATLSY